MKALADTDENVQYLQTQFVCAGRPCKELWVYESTSCFPVLHLPCMHGGPWQPLIWLAIPDSSWVGHCRLRTNMFPCFWKPYIKINLNLKIYPQLRPLALLPMRTLKWCQTQMCCHLLFSIPNIFYLYLLGIRRFLRRQAAMRDEFASLLAEHNYPLSMTCDATLTVL